MHQATGLIPRTREILAAEGPPITTRELAGLTGMSLTFIRKEIHAKEVQAIEMGRGRKRVFRILRAEARRYLRQLGLLQAAYLLIILASSAESIITPSFS